jgi:hypothetical protein
MLEQKQTKRRTRLMIETERVLIVTGHQSDFEGWCDQCGAEVKLVAPELAATLTGLSRRAVYRLIETGQIHFTESAEALVSVCLQSLTTVKPSRTDSSLQLKLRRLVMKSAKNLSLILTLMFALCASAAYAQNGAAQLKKQIFAQVASGQRAQARSNISDSDPDSALETQSLVGITGLDKKRGLLGTWDITLTFSDDSQVKSTLQVFPGRSDTEGSVIHASEFSLVPPNPTLPEQGVWEFLGGQEFVTSYRGYSFTEELTPFGLIGFRHRITMSSDQESFTGRAVFEVLDSTGQVLFSDNVRTRGVRQHPLAP